jgi:hypothetical protein
MNAEAVRMFEPEIEEMNDAGREVQMMQGGTIPEYAANGKKITKRKMPNGKIGLWQGNTYLGIEQEDSSFLGDISKAAQEGWSEWNPFKADGGPVYLEAGGNYQRKERPSWLTEELLDSLMMVESGGDTNAVSKAGAIGPYQIMPATAANPGYFTQPITEADMRDPIRARLFADQYLSGIAAANPDWSQEQVLQAYNFGPGNVQKVATGERTDIPVEAQQYAGKVMSGVKAPVQEEASVLGKIGEALTSMFGIPSAEAATVPAPAGAPPKPEVPANPNVRSINKFGKVVNYQKEAGKWYRIKDDGTLAKDPATGLIAANLNNQDSPITSEGTAPEVPMPTGDLPAGSRGSGEYLDTKTTNRAQPAAPPKPDDLTDALDPPVPDVEQTYLHEASNILYTVDENGMLRNSYGHPAPVPVQDAFNQKRAGTADPGTTRPEFEVTPTRIKTADELAAEANKLSQKAKDEVKETGQVSNETATAIAQNQGQATQVNQFEINRKRDEEIAEAKRRKQAEENRSTLMSEYEKQRNVAENAGVTDFPTFDEWKKRQNITTDTDTGVTEKPKPGEKAAKQSEVLTAITKQINSIDDKSAAGTTESQAQKAVTNAGADGEEKVSKAESFLSGIFGDLFDAKELKRMAILYAGSRLMGASHGGALNWAGKAYLTRVDAKEAEHAATIKKLITDGKYTPKSIQEYKKTKDASVLMKLGPKVSPTGTKEMWYTPQGKRVQAEKFKVGDGYVWSTDGGKTAIPAAWHQDAARIPGTDKYNDRIRVETGLLKDSIKELSTAIGDVTPGDSNRGIKRTQRTNITPTNAALEAAQWAAKNGIDVAQMNTYVEQAYRMAVEQSGGENNVKPESLLPYLNQLKLRQDTGQDELFNVTTKDGATVPMDAVKIEELSRQFIKRAGGEGSISDGRNRDAVNLFWTKAAEIWNKKVIETPDIVEQYERRAGPGETAFYVYAKEQLGLPMATE